MFQPSSVTGKSFQEYMFRLPEFLLESSEHTDYLAAEQLNQLAQDIEQQLTKAINQHELLPELQTGLTADIVISLLMDFVLQTKATAPTVPTAQLHNQLEAFYGLIKI